MWHALNYYAYEDASFLAERLFLESKGCETLYLLATCYFRQGRVAEAYDLLKRSHSTTPKCRLLFAQCCLKLNKLVFEQLLSDLSRSLTLEITTVAFGLEFYYHNRKLCDQIRGGAGVVFFDVEQSVDAVRAWDVIDIYISHEQCSVHAFNFINLSLFLFKPCTCRLYEGEQILIGTSGDGSLATLENNVTSEFQEISGICLSILATIYRSVS